MSKPIERIESLEGDVANLYAAVAGLIREPVVLVVNVTLVSDASETDDTEPLSTEEQLDLFIAAKQPVVFDYVDAKDVPSCRLLSPYELTEDGRLIGWDHNRKALRSFVLDRVTYLSASDEEPYREPVTGSAD